MTIDLHVHSTFSDGSMSPGELVSFAKMKGLSALAITDHDTIDGTKEAQLAGRTVGVEIVPGIEVSVKYYDYTVHLLGYYYQQNDVGLADTLKKLQSGRFERNRKILIKLRDQGIRINQEDLCKISKIGQTGRPHIAKVLMMKGAVKNMNEAFAKYLAKGASAYISRFVLTAVDAISLIKNAGGVAVLAHPLQLVKSGATLREAIEDLVISGLDGIEAYYPTHSKKHQKMFLEIAKELNLVVTGGSDYHGDVRPGTTLAGGKNVSVPVGVLSQLKERAVSNRKINCTPLTDLGIVL